MNTGWHNLYCNTRDSKIQISLYSFIYLACCGLLTTNMLKIHYSISILIFFLLFNVNYLSSKRFCIHNFQAFHTEDKSLSVIITMY